MSGHTPGPWHVGPHYKSDVESQHGRICDCGITRGPNGEANARLIAAAPDLLEALKEMVEWHGGVHGEDCPEDDTCDCIGAGINERVNAAIAKAEGTVRRRKGALAKAEETPS